MKLAIEDNQRVESLLKEGKQAMDDNDLDTATERFQQVTRLDRENPVALHRLGQIAYFRAQYPLALRLLTEALRLRNHFPAALNSLGGVLMKMKEWDAARDTLEGALRQKPRDSGTLSNLGAVHLELGDDETAEKYLRRAVDLNPAHAIAWNNLGNIYFARGSWSRASAHYQKALGLSPDNSEALRNLGGVLTKLGDMEGAVNHFHRALDLDPMAVDALNGLAAAKKFVPDDPDLLRFRRAAKSASGWSRDQRIGFFFSWGKALDDARQYDDAFVCFDNGNRLRSEERPYRPEAFRRFVDGIMEVFGKLDLDGLRAEGTDDDTPVFIVGMPRSGTTLTEQILASHSAVFGAGELPTFGGVMDAVLDGPMIDHYPAWLESLNGEVLRRVASEYLKRRPRAPRGARRVTDKMPGNFLHLGLIRLAMPNARIIHCVRNPMDVCLSCFQKNFKEGQAFSFRQEWLGHRYSEYARLMEFWRTVFPGQWLDVSYEGVVDDTEGWARRIVDFAGLEWEDACLDFHRTKRAVHTASVWQVRQPVYRSAVERWRRYEAHLGPMLEHLNGYENWHRDYLGGQAG